MRSRNLKPGLFKNELLGSADPLYTLVFEGLWCLADREGRLEDRPSRIHVEINPYRPGASTVQALDWLGAQKFILRYTVLGTSYLQVVNFSAHQQPHVKEAKSKFPGPSDQEPTGSTGQAPGKNGASTGQAPLIPDSCNPLSRGRAQKNGAPEKIESRIRDMNGPRFPLKGQGG